MNVKISFLSSWVPDPIAGYTVKGAYHSLLADLTGMPSASIAVVPSIWRKDVPLKVSVFAWRMFRDRLPTKDNLSRRKYHSGRCPGVWYLVHHWLSVPLVNPLSISNHYLQFRISSGFAIFRCSFMHLLWFASIWVIWKEMNARIFRAKESTMHQLLENIKLISFSWFKANSISFYYKFYDWSQNPFHCVGNG
uniref:Reverse transcriptase zinc-binding domain-containing protein n=1 Tax=Medicago truncatula TaxID=3880 RepID=Q2HW20_MEDTR|nr:hypothetical protein MtrDRAFT_AC148289g7v2 [Medicago truncatula]